MLIVENDRNILADTENITCKAKWKTMEKGYYYKCDCGGEVLVIEPEITHVDNDKSFLYLNLSIWYMGGNGKLSWFERLRYCWYILTRGRAYADEIILGLDEIERLQRDLGEILF